MVYFWIQFFFLAIPALVSGVVVYYIASKIERDRKRNVFFLGSCLLSFAITIVSVVVAAWLAPPGVEHLLLAWLLLLIGLSSTIGALAGAIIWKMRRR